MKYHTLSILFIVNICFFSSCDRIKSWMNHIPDEKLKVIDGIILGKPTNNGVDILDSMRFLKKLTLTCGNLFEYNSLVSGYNLTDYLTNFYITKRFNYGEFINNDQNINHNFIIQPITLNKYLVGIRVYCGHYEDPFTSDLHLSQVFNQNINQSVKNFIFNDYLMKYGVPDETKEKRELIYVILKNNINTYSFFSAPLQENGEEQEILGKSHIWNTEYYTIKYFEGIPSLDGIYSKNNKSYGYSMASSYESKNSQFNPRIEENCYKFGFIEYYLNDVALEKLDIYTIQDRGI